MSVVHNNVLYLSVSGFYIRVNFKPTEWLYAKKVLVTDIRQAFKGFIVPGGASSPVSYTVNITEQPNLHMIYKKEEKKSFIIFYREVKKWTVETYYQISIIQFQTIIRSIIVELLAKHHGFMLHASASLIREKAVVFMGDNDAGKSTAMKLLSSKFPALADDTVFIRKEGGLYYLYQTPFIEKESWVIKKRVRYPLSSFFFLKKSPIFKISPIYEPEKIMNLLVKQMWSIKPYETKHMTYLMRCAGKYNHFSFLYFAKKPQAFIRFMNRYET